MNKDLFTAIGAAILGFAIAYLVCNMFLQPISPKSYKVLETTASAALEEPNPEVFNYRALNPTVEVYVGDCNEFNEYGECVDGKTKNNANTQTTDTDTNQENP